MFLPAFAPAILIAASDSDRCPLAYEPATSIAARFHALFAFLQAILIAAPLHLHQRPAVAYVIHVVHISLLFKLKPCITGIIFRSHVHPSTNV